MTDQDNLRERVAKALYDHDMQVQFPGAPWIPDWTSGDNRQRDTYQDRAQVVIDALHLESYPFTRHDGHTTTHAHGWMEPRP